MEESGKYISTSFNGLKASAGINASFALKDALNPKI
jgi:hypothetical protein